MSIMKIPPPIRTKPAVLYRFLQNKVLNLTLAAGEQEKDASGVDDPGFYYVKLGYIAQINQMGFTAFAVDYGKFDDRNQNEDEADTIGIMGVQQLKEWNTELYLCYRHYELDRTSEDYDDIDAVMSGLRIKF